MDPRRRGAARGVAARGRRRALPGARRSASAARQQRAAGRRCGARRERRRARSRRRRRSIRRRCCCARARASSSAISRAVSRPFATRRRSGRRAPTLRIPRVAALLEERRFAEARAALDEAYAAVPDAAASAPLRRVELVLWQYQAQDALLRAVEAGAQGDAAAREPTRRAFDEALVRHPRARGARAGRARGVAGAGWRSRRRADGRSGPSRRCARRSTPDPERARSVSVAREPGDRRAATRPRPSACCARSCRALRTRRPPRVTLARYLAARERDDEAIALLDAALDAAPRRRDAAASRAPSCCSTREQLERGRAGDRAGRGARQRASRAPSCCARAWRSRAATPTGARARLEQLAPRARHRRDAVLARPRARAQRGPTGAAHRYRLSAARDRGGAGPVARAAAARAGSAATRARRARRRRALLQRAPALIDGWQGLVDALIRGGRGPRRRSRPRSARWRCCPSAARRGCCWRARCARSGRHDEALAAARRAASALRRPRRRSPRSACSRWASRAASTTRGRGGAARDSPRIGRQRAAAPCAGRRALPGRPRPSRAPPRWSARWRSRRTTCVRSRLRCQLQAATARFEARVRDCARFLERHPDHAEMRFALGVAQAGAGRRRRGRRRATAARPRSTRARSRRATTWRCCSPRAAISTARSPAAQEAFALARREPGGARHARLALSGEGARRARDVAARGRPRARAASWTRRSLHLALAYRAADARTRRARCSTRSRTARRLVARAAGRARCGAGCELALPSSRSAARWLRSLRWPTAGGLREPAGAARRDRARALAALGRPNLVLIVVDTLRADRTTPYGFAEDTTPELARWAAHGVVFERALAQSSWTKISMASLLTSLWPHSHAMHDVRDGLGRGRAHPRRGAARRRLPTLCGADERLARTSPSASSRASSATSSRPAAARSCRSRASGPTSTASSRRPRACWPRTTASTPFFLYLHFMDVHEYAAPPEFKRFGSDAARRLPRRRPLGRRRHPPRARGARGSAGLARSAR